jgi:hypothetical protein
VPLRNEGKEKAKNQCGAKAILMRELGSADYTHFIQQFQEGTGEFTRDRCQLLGDESARILREQATRLAVNGEL